MKQWGVLGRLTVVVGAMTMAMPSVADRGQKYEFAFTVPYLNGETVNFDGGASASLNSDPGFGFRAGFNYTDHISISGQFLWNSTSYDAVRVLDDGERTEQSVRGVLDGFTANLGVDYYLFDGDFTP